MQLSSSHTNVIVNSEFQNLEQFISQLSRNHTDIYLRTDININVIKDEIPHIPCLLI